MKDLRVLVSGAGSIGQRHMRLVHELGVSQIAYADPKPDPEVMPALRAEIGAEEFLGFSDALKSFKPNTVLICSPTGLHVQQAIEAANAGCHIFTEKPLSHSLDGVDELEEIVSDRNLITMVACNMRFHPGPKKIKELIDQGAIGDVIAARIRAGSYLPRWRRKVPYLESYSTDPNQGGVLLDLVHEIDLALWYFGHASIEHAAVLPATSIKAAVDGLAELLLKHESGTLSNLHLSFIQHTWRRGCEIIGSEGAIEWELRMAPGMPSPEEAKVELYGNDGNLVEAFPAESDRDQAYRDELRHFLESVTQGKQTSAPLSDGKESLTIALNARDKLV